MLLADKWEDYELIDAADGQKLERWGSVILNRPDPQVIWKEKSNSMAWADADAKYHRSKSGGGEWEFSSNLPQSWQIKYKNLAFNVKPMGFKHTGLFPEQAVNWDFITDALCKRSGASVLNLFAYTGGATVAAASAGAKVVHVDAAKGMVQWAKENAASSSLKDAPIRYIVDDCLKFAQREIRRGHKYDAIIMDPPSYGRGPGGEIWKLENEVYSFVELCSQVLSDNPIMVLINSYTTGLSPAVMQYILGALIKPKFGGVAESDEIGLPVTQTGMILPCGASAIWHK